MKFSTKITTDEDILDVNVVFNYYPGDSVFTNDMDIDAPEIEILSIKCDGLEMNLDFFNKHQINQIENEAMEYVSEYDKNSY